MQRGLSLVFVPGSWHRPACYDKVIAELQSQQGLQCRKVTLPSTSGDRNAGFKDDLDATHQVVMKEIDQGRDVVVVAHSYGGLVGSSVIKKSLANRAGSEASITGLILIATGFAITGWSFMDPLFGITPPSWRKNAQTGFAELIQPPGPLFYHDVLPKEEADYWVSQLTSQSLPSLFEGGGHVYAGWKNVPVWYIGTTEDRALPIWVQRMQVGMARGQGGNVVHRELASSHSPFLSRPNDVVRIIDEALEEFRRTPGDSADAVRRRDATLVKLWPQRWYKCGLFAGLGEMVGRTIVFAGWCRGVWRS